MLKQITFLPLVALVIAILPVPSAEAERRNEQNDARALMMSGKIKSIRSIENNILPKMAGSQYLGPEFDSTAQVYRLKFIRDGRVVFVDVDGRTGAIINQR
ncbi:PepSY domain-containing protein [Parasphingorhabdus halotolerans]|uniref:PepSY domain-containing protein n=1 Tax=Parasphingorhabdus halotolerans TaxID=2725558 RepID=A0A6H2DPD1_9SPHN|nr:PepSY domain-containing protein [Parasphingorhabdus halotolerans]QJB70522.1 hypothetical protein HF685_15695 [Parasphingorhabdus halotolerans]